MINCESYLAAVRKQSPLILHITNSVTINDCANALICTGASPVMSNCTTDSIELAKTADALLLNIGTVNEYQLNQMVTTAKTAQNQNIPIILDPVGAGASAYRTDAAKNLMKYASVIKGNAGEIAALSGISGKTRGVDSINTSTDITTTADSLARKSGSIIIVSGKVDYITDGAQYFCVSNGDVMMSRISGTGCMASSVCAAFAAVNNTDLISACAAAMTYFGIAGETACKNAAGPGTFKAAFFDALANFKSDDFAKAKIQGGECK